MIFRKEKTDFGVLRKGQNKKFSYQIVTIENNNVCLEVTGCHIKKNKQEEYFGTLDFSCKSIQAATTLAEMMDELLQKAMQQNLFDLGE